jgi:hypothetical protein
MLQPIDPGTMAAQHLDRYGWAIQAVGHGRFGD